MTRHVQRLTWRITPLAASGQRALAIRGQGCASATTRAQPSNDSGGVNAIAAAVGSGHRPTPSASTSFWPREHGAYGQVTFPILAAFMVAGVSSGGLLIALSVIAAFLSHEPAAVLLGHRGPRARRERGGPAAVVLSVLAVAGAAAGASALYVMPATARVSVVVPLLPASVLLIAMLRNREKSWYGECAAALAFAGVSMPIARAAGTSLEASVGIALPFALLFVTTTLAVRVVILRVRGGGDPRAAAATRRATLIVAIGSALALVSASLSSQVGASVLVAAIPGLTTASLLAVRPPPASRLRRVGWTLVGVSFLTLVLVVTSASVGLASS